MSLAWRSDSVITVLPTLARACPSFAFSLEQPPTTNASPVLNTGFGLKASGDSLYLFNRPQSGGELLDGTSFGIQAPDWSIGRVPNGGSNWVLNLPTQGSANIGTALGNPASLKINEWMADNKGPGGFPDPADACCQHRYQEHEQHGQTEDCNWYVLTR